MSKTSYKVYVGEVGSAYTDKVHTAADYAAAVKNVADADDLIAGATDALDAAQSALTDAQAAMTEVKRAKINAEAALANLQNSVDTTRAAYEAAIAHSQDGSESAAVEAAKIAYEAAVAAYNKFDAILVDTDADIPALNSKDNYEDLLASTIEDINAIIVRAQSVLEEAQAYKQKATSDMENYKNIADEAAEYFESLLPEDFNKISPNDENDNIERAIQAKIDAVNSDVESARNVIDKINESTAKINNGISEANVPVTPADDSDDTPADPADEDTVFVYAGTDEVTSDNFGSVAEELTNTGINKSFDFGEEETRINIVVPAEGVVLSATTTTPLGTFDVEFEDPSAIEYNGKQYSLYVVELTNLNVNITLA